MFKKEYFSSLYTIFEPPNLNAKLGGHEAKNGEDGEAGGEGGHAVANAHDHGVPQDVVVEPGIKVVTIIIGLMLRIAMLLIIQMINKNILPMLIFDDHRDHNYHQLNVTNTCYTRKRAL